MLGKADVILMSRLAAIHGKDPLDPSGLGGQEMDLGRAETQAMVEAYLGPDFPPAKLEWIVYYQSMFRHTQDHLQKLLDSGDLSAHEYVDGVNGASDSAMSACFEILGEADFASLFGGTLLEVQYSLHINFEAFVRQHEQQSMETGSFLTGSSS